MSNRTLLVYILSLVLVVMACEKVDEESEEETVDPNAIMDIDGNIYTSVIIGDQEWMVENLKVTHYRDGNAIAKIVDATEWFNSTAGAYCSYNNDDTNAEIYGSLYNWYAVKDSQNIAPEGWHVPSDDEWKALEVFLGMNQEIADQAFWRGPDVSGKLRTVDGWNIENGANNESGFSALPGGARDEEGVYFWAGSHATFWTSTEDYYGPWDRILADTTSNIFRYPYHWNAGFSIRCVRDESAH